MDALTLYRVARPDCFTADVEAAFIREYPRSPNEPRLVAERALVGTPYANEPGSAINIRDYFNSCVELRNKCVDRLEAIKPEELYALPSKEEFANEILQFARNEKNRQNASAADKEFALRCYRLAADVMGMVDKGGGTNIQINNRSTVNKVMILPPDQSLEEWSAQTKKQQSQLIVDAAATARP